MSYIKINTTVEFPDRTLLELFIKEEDEDIFITDSGMTIGWIMAAKGYKTRYANLPLFEKESIVAACNSRGVEIKDGEIQIKVQSTDQSEHAVLAVTSAIQLLISSFFFNTKR